LAAVIEEAFDGKWEVPPTPAFGLIQRPTIDDLSFRFGKKTAKFPHEFGKAGHQLRFAGGWAKSRNSHRARRACADSFDWLRAGVDFFYVNSRA